MMYGWRQKGEKVGDRRGRTSLIWKIWDCRRGLDEETKWSSPNHGPLALLVIWKPGCEEETVCRMYGTMQEQYGWTIFVSLIINRLRRCFRWLRFQISAIDRLRSGQSNVKDGTVSYIRRLKLKYGITLSRNLQDMLSVYLRSVLSGNPNVSRFVSCSRIPISWVNLGADAQTLQKNVRASPLSSGLSRFSNVSTFKKYILPSTGSVRPCK